MPCSFCKNMVRFMHVLLDTPVAKREPSGYDDVYSVGTQSGHYGRKSGRPTVRPHFSMTGRVLLVCKRTIFYFWESVNFMLHIGRARHPGPGKCFLTLVSCLLSLSMWVVG